MSMFTCQRVLLSQNFLRDSRLVANLLDRLGLGGESLVIEIGPGRGIITEQLAKRFRRVIAIEKDARLSCLLRKEFQDQPHVAIHPGDVLDYHLPRTPYNVFANIPFNITSDIVAKLTEAEFPPDDAYLVMQREAAEMYLGRSHESLRTVLMKPWFETEIVHRFQRRDFAPTPRVDVVMLRLRKRGPPLICDADRQYFRDFVVYEFTHWQPTAPNPLKRLLSRRQLNYLARELGPLHARIPTAMTIEQWIRLFTAMKAICDAPTRSLVSGSEHRLRQQQARLEKIHRTRHSGHKM